MGLGKGDPLVDHIDGDGLNNLLSNLRVTDNAGNAHNRHGKRRRRDGSPPTSLHPGACWDKRAAKWCARIMLDSRGMHLGYFDDEADAADAYAEAKAARDAGGTKEDIRAGLPSRPARARCGR